MRRLKDWAQELYDDFQDQNRFSGGCSCHINPPCGYCTDPGNPANLEEDDTAWEEVDDANINSG